MYIVPGGFVDNTDSNGHFTAAIRETREEAGIDVKLLGILRIENQMNRYHGRQRVIFYGEPIDPTQSPKSISDKESVSAAWLSLDELEEKGKLRPPHGLRGKELLVWARYIENGGTIYPLNLFAHETDTVPFQSKET